MLDNLRRRPPNGSARVEFEACLARAVSELG
jgi:hypothetical protein